MFNHHFTPNLSPLCIKYHRNIMYCTCTIAVRTCFVHVPPLMPFLAELLVYSWKCWPSLNLVVGPQTKCIEGFKCDGAPARRYMYLIWRSQLLPQTANLNLIPRQVFRLYDACVCMTRITLQELSLGIKIFALVVGCSISM